MLTTQTLKSTNGSRKKAKRLGRGNGSGHGTYSGRGMNGQNCRSGGGVPDWFEGGQTPLFRRMPKLKGFSNAKFKKHFTIINLYDLELAAEKKVKEVNVETLFEAGIIRKKSLPLKLLGKGEIKSKINVSVDAASASAVAAIEKAWGTLTLPTSSASDSKDAE